MNPQLLQMMMSILAGAGFGKIADGVNRLSQSGADIQTLFSMPNMPLMMAGAGMKDAANSMELITPLIKAVMPPQNQQAEQQDPQKMAAAMSMLSAQLGPGLSGIQAPPPQMPNMPMR